MGLLALVLAAVATLVAVAELWVLPWRLGVDRQAFLLGFTATESRVDDVPINALGFTGDDLASPKADGTIRVLTLGGSALFNRRMTARLKDALAAASPRRVEVLGAALRAHTTWSSVHKYRYLAHHDFDLVLVYHGINDLYANHVAPDDFRTDYSHLRAWYRRHPLLDRSVIARAIYNRFLHDTPEGRMAGAGFAAADVFRANLATLVDEVQRDGGTPVLLTFAWSIPGHYTDEAFARGEVGYHNPEGYDRVPVSYWGPAPWVREGLARHDLVVHELAAERDVPLIDQRRWIGEDLVWFGDVCHLSEAGTRRFVENVARELAAQGLLE